jgi:hypothetical protein
MMGGFSLYRIEDDSTVHRNDLPGGTEDSSDAAVATCW